jgi:lysophospholipase L1-like esterase
MAGGPTTACAACPCGYGSQLDPLFNSNVTVVNNAVGGLTIQTWLYQGVSSTPDANGECAVTNTAFNSRWTNMLSGTSAMKAGDYLFISFGINDGDASCPKHVGQAKYLGYLNLMVTAAKDLGVEPILMPPVGAIDCGGGSTAVNIRNPYFTTATNDAGAANNVPVIDLGQLSVDLYNSLGLCPNSADYTSTTSKVGQFFCQDHTHFELAGAKQIAQLIAKALKDQVIAESTSQPDGRNQRDHSGHGHDHDHGFLQPSWRCRESSRPAKKHDIGSTEAVEPARRGKHGIPCRPDCFFVSDFCTPNVALRELQWRMASWAVECPLALLRPIGHNGHHVQDGQKGGSRRGGGECRGSQEPPVGTPRSRGIRGRAGVDHPPGKADGQVGSSRVPGRWPWSRRRDGLAG